MKINPSWITWAKNYIGLLKDGGYAIYPRDGAIFQVSHTGKTLELIGCRPDWFTCGVEAINTEVFKAIGYRYVKHASTPTTPEAILDKVLGNLQRYASDITSLLHGIENIFSVRSVEEVIAKMGKKLPVNPVTIRGRNVLNTEPGNLTVGRLWIGTDSVPDGSHRFDSKAKRVQWDKPITLILWSKEDLLASVVSAKSHLVVDEEEFIRAIKRLRTEPDIVLKVWGKLTRLGNETASIVFRRSTAHDNMLVTVYTGEDNKTQAANVTLDFDKFIEGLGYLFPNGELS